MLTFTGIHITKEFGAPSIRDIAVQSMRLVRFSGAAEVFWPIGMHMLLVADLMPKALERPRLVAPPTGGVALDPDWKPTPNPWLEVHGLLHDAAEVVVSDVPRPMKTAEARTVEDRVQSRIYAALGVPEPTAEMKAAIKQADFRAALAEGALGCAGRGYEQTQNGFHYDEEANEIIRRYLSKLSLVDAFDPDGQWARFYEARLRQALREAQRQISYAPDHEILPARESATTPASRLLDAVEDLYLAHEHRPSCQMVKDTIVRALEGEAVR